MPTFDNGEVGSSIRSKINTAITKIDGVEEGATGDQTGAEIKALYEAEADTNAFTDADHSKLDGIEASADVTDTANVTAAGSLMKSELTDETAVKAINQGLATTDSPTFVAPIFGHAVVNGYAFIQAATRGAAITALTTLGVTPGIVVATDLSVAWEYDGSNTDRGIADMLGCVPYGNALFRHFGTVGDGSTDDTSAISETIDFSIDNGVWVYGHPADTYKLTSNITKTGAALIDWCFARWTKTTTGNAFKFSATTATHDLSADYTLGATTLSVTDTGTALADNQPSLIVCDANALQNRDRGSEDSQYRIGEFPLLGAGHTTTTINLVRPLRKVKGINPVSTAGDEARVDAYTTAYNARLVVPDASERFVFKNFSGGYEDGHSTGDADPWGGTFLSVIGYVEPLIENIRQTRGYDASIRAKGTHWALIRNCHAENLDNDTSNGRLGYGVSDGGYGTIVEASSWRNCRHGYTTGATQTEADDSNVDALYGVPGAEDCLVDRCYADGFPANSPFNTHHDGRGITFRSCVAKDCATNAFSLRGTRIRVEAPFIRNCLHGINAQTEWDNDQANDDKRVSDKTADSFTSVYVTDPDIETEDSCFRVDVSRLEVHGRARLRSATHQLFQRGDGDGSRGAIILNVQGDFKVTDFDGAMSYVAENASGIFDFEKPTQSSDTTAYPTTTIEVLAGTDLDIDVSNTTSTGIFGIDLDHNDVTFVNRGRLKFLLPSDGNLFSSTGTFATEHGGGFIVELDGAADNANDHNLIGQDARVWAEDSTINWFAHDPNGKMHRLYGDQTETTVNGNAGPTMQNGVYDYNLENVRKHMGARGGGEIHVRQRAKKTGTTAAATWRHETLGNLDDQFDVASGDNYIDVDLTFSITSDTAYTSLYKTTATDNAASATGVVRGRARDNTATSLETDGGKILSLDPTITTGDAFVIQHTEVYVSSGGFF